MSTEIMNNSSPQRYKSSFEILVKDAVRPFENKGLHLLIKGLLKRMNS